MADVAGPVACEACGRLLPSQQGRGRRRRYCDATSAALNGAGGRQPALRDRALLRLWRHPVAPHRFGGSKLVKCPHCGVRTWASPVPKQ